MAPHETPDPELGSSSTVSEIPDGVYLVRVQKATYRWHKEKPFYDLSFYVLEPKTLVEAAITARLSCFPKSLWKLAWFQRDFRYIQELLEQDEICRFDRLLHNRDSDLTKAVLRHNLLLVSDAG